MRAKMNINQLDSMLSQMKNYHQYHNMSDTIYISVNDKTGEIEFEQSSYWQECVGKFFRYTCDNQPLNETDNKSTSPNQIND